jgi:hypothetical protein
VPSSIRFGSTERDARSTGGSPEPVSVTYPSARPTARSGRAASATQCRSNPVSYRGLPKTGIFQISTGDYRRFRSRNGQFRRPETDNQFAKARHWRAFLRLLGVKSPSTALPGWRRSVDRTRLRVDSLLTGNLTGKIGISALWETILEQKAAAPQRLVG